MAKTKKKYRKSKPFRVSIGVVAGLMPGVSNAFSALQLYGIDGMGTQISRDYLGYDPKSGAWHLFLMKGGALPLFLGGLISKLATKSGLNRIISNAIPFIKI